MGNWAHNYHVRTRSYGRVRTEMERLAELDVLVSRDKGGWVTVFEQGGSDTEARRRIAAELSRALDADVLSWSIADDDVTVIGAWRAGTAFARFDSCPGYLGGEVDDATWAATDGAPERLLALCVRGTSSEALRAALVRTRDPEAEPPFTFETERVAVLAPLFGIAVARAGAAFEDLQGDPQLARVPGARSGGIDPRVRLLRDRLIERDEATIERWLDEGFDPNARNERGRRVFESVLNLGSTRLVERFIERGAEPGGSLSLYVLRGELEAVRALLAHDVDLDATDGAGYTPLYRAVGEGNLAMVELLLEAGADVNLSHDLVHRVPPSRVQGVRVLMRAARDGHVEIVERLLRAGADPNARDAHGRSAAEYAEARGHRALAERLRATE